MGCGESRASEYPEEDAKLLIFLQPEQVNHPQMAKARVAAPESAAKKHAKPSALVPQQINQPLTVKSAPDSEHLTPEHTPEPAPEDNNSSTGEMKPLKDARVLVRRVSFGLPTTLRDAPEDEPLQHDSFTRTDNANVGAEVVEHLMTPSAKELQVAQVKGIARTYDLFWAEINVPASTHEEPEEYPMTPSIRNSMAAQGRGSQELKGRTDTYDLTCLEIHVPAPEEYPMTPTVRKVKVAPCRGSWKQKGRTGTYDFAWAEVDVPASTHEEPQEYLMTPSARNWKATQSRGSQELKQATGTYDLTWVDVNVPARDE